MCRAWAPQAAFPRGEGESHRDERTGNAAQKPPPVLARGLEGFRREVVSPRKHENIQEAERFFQ